MVIFGLIASILAMVAGIGMIVVGVREGRKLVGDKSFSFKRQELKYSGLPFAVFGLLCTLMLLSSYAGGWLLEVTGWLFVGVIGGVCLGFLGAVITQLGESGRGRRRR